MLPIMCAVKENAFMYRCARKTLYCCIRILSYLISFYCFYYLAYCDDCGRAAWRTESLCGRHTQLMAFNWEILWILDQIL